MTKEKREKTLFTCNSPISRVLNALLPRHPRQARQDCCTSLVCIKNVATTKNLKRYPKTVKLGVLLLTAWSIVAQHKAESPPHISSPCASVWHPYERLGNFTQPSPNTAVARTKSAGNTSIHPTTRALRGLRQDTPPPRQCCSRSRVSTTLHNQTVQKKKKTRR